MIKSVYPRSMIITRSPLRISLGGGGTDLASYYEKFEGYFIAAAINKYVYVATTRPFQQGIFLKYSKIESAQRIHQIEHPIMREVLNLLDLKTPQIEVTSIADIPAGTGLGSSGSFTTAVIKSLYTHYKKVIHSEELAELACRIEIENLKEPIGKQDQYISAFGGLMEFRVGKNGKVHASPLPVPIQTLHKLEDNLLLFFTGISRSASEILKDQNTRTQKEDNSMLENLHFVKEIGLRSRAALIEGKVEELGRLMNEHWEYKRARSQGMTTSKINFAYEEALENGAIGGKLVGAGGGGFLLFYAEDKERLRNKMRDLAFEEVRFNFDFEGTKVILS